MVLQQLSAKLTCLTCLQALAFHHVLAVPPHYHIGRVDYPIIQRPHHLQPEIGAAEGLPWR